MSKIQLIELELEGNYVFHGSGMPDLEYLEPKQGRHIPDMNKGDQFILDGEPAVSATPYVDFAIFRALINNNNIDFDFNSRFGFRGGEKEFRVSSKKVLDNVQNKKGFVYVFDRKDFSPYSRDGIPKPENMEWRSYKTVKPLQALEVSFIDLPDLDLIEITDK